MRTEEASKILELLTKHHKYYTDKLTFFSFHYLYLGFQALKGSVASLGLQASLVLMETKENLEVQDYYISLNCQVRKRAFIHLFILCVPVYVDCSHPPSMTES